MPPGLFTRQGRENALETDGFKLFTRQGRENALKTNQVTLIEKCGGLGFCICLLFEQSAGQIIIYLSHGLWRNFQPSINFVQSGIPTGKFQN